MDRFELARTTWQSGAEVGRPSVIDNGRRTKNTTNALVSKRSHTPRKLFNLAPLAHREPPHVVTMVDAEFAFGSRTPTRRLS